MQDQVQGSIEPNQNDTFATILKFLKDVLKYWYIVAICLVIGAGSGFLYRKITYQTQYKASASFFITDSSNVITISNVLVGSKFAEDYLFILQDRDTLNRVIETLNLNMNCDQLLGMLSFDMTENSHIITASATTNDPTLSKNIVNTELQVGKERIYDIISGSTVAIISLATDEGVKAVTSANMMKYVGYGILFGLAAAIAVIYVITYGDNTLDDEEEIEDLLKLPILASIPFFDNQKLKNITSDDLDFLTHEALNTFCTNINLSGYGIKSIAFTSTIPNEGKSTITYLAARIFTEFGKHVVIIDGDLRKSNLVKLLGVNANDISGLSDYLTKDMKMEDILYRTDNPMLDAVFTGKYPPNPSALLSADRFKELLEKLSEDYDYVLVDTPPVSSVVDGLIISKACDGCIMLVEFNKTDASKAERIKKNLESAGVKLLGVVINKLKYKGFKYGKYGKYSKYYDYAPYGNLDREGEEKAD